MKKIIFVFTLVFLLCMGCACAEMLEKAKANAQRYWDELVAKLDAYYDAHAGLRELLAKAEASRKAGKAG